MGSMSVWHWLIVLAVVLLLFGGGGKIPRLMKDLGTGVKSFKKGLKEGEDKSEAKTEETKAIEAEAVSTSTASKDKTAASS
ncbi:MAG TPA: twin-arginine translocase TatA/TatE family subunit [Kiloniellales bacterium]|nr:twin-arginine translocase TatA/TatE family subunit [Kiloniellales bacterium]